MIVGVIDENACSGGGGVEISGGGYKGQGWGLSPDFEYRGELHCFIAAWRIGPCEERGLVHPGSRYLDDEILLSEVVPEIPQGSCSGLGRHDSAAFLAGDGSDVFPQSDPRDEP